MRQEREVIMGVQQVVTAAAAAGNGGAVLLRTSGRKHCTHLSGE